MITTRAFAVPDEQSFLQLYRECLNHYGIRPATTDEEARVLALLCEERHMSCLMAFDGALPVGFATWTLTFPAGPGVALYMKELFVGASARRKGVARKLMVALIDIAKTENCTRIDWRVMTESGV